MIGLLALYGLCLFSGFLVERCFSIDSLVERVLIVFSVGTAQLLLTIQALSLPKWVSVPGLLLANGIASAMICAVLHHASRPTTRRSWKMLAVSSWKEIQTLRTEKAFLFSGIGVFLFIMFSWAMGLTLMPSGDGYHYDMPIFWAQHHSILPFAAPNPRVISTAFASEALCLPGYVFCHTDKLIAVLTLASALLCIWIIFSIALRLGCSFIAAGTSAILTAGYAVYALALIDMKAEMFLAMAWTAGSLLFLLEANQPRDPDSQRLNLGWSLFCFILACGAKNTCILSAPFFLIAVLIILKGSQHKRKEYLNLIVVGSIAVFCSGVAWNYASNVIWFGNAKGPPFMQGHTSKDFSAHSMWTRLARGSVMFVTDPTWLPSAKQQNTYSDWCAKSLYLLGSQEQLAEDDDFFGLKKIDMRPQMGFGLLGLFVFLPALMLGLLRIFRNGHGTKDRKYNTNVSILVLVTLGSFIVPHILLKSQCIGIIRILPFFLVAGAPLTAPIFESRYLRIAGLTLLAICCSLFVKLDSKYVQFWGSYEGSRILHKIAHLSTDTRKSINLTWDGGKPTNILSDERSTFKEVSLSFLSNIKQPAIIGFVGGVNSELFHLFGHNFLNRIVPLTDIRKEGLIKDPDANIEYIVFSDYGSGPQPWKFGREIDKWSDLHGFRPIFLASREGKCFFKAFKRNAT